MRELCFTAALLTSGCAGGYQLHPQPALSAGRGDVTWHAPAEPRDVASLDRWRAAVGSPLVRAAAIHTDPVDRLTVISWNIALDGADVASTVRKVLSDRPRLPVVLLLQEAYRSGDDIPNLTMNTRFAAALGTSRDEREIDAVADALGLSLYYVPSMRNGAGREDRGNAILTNLPLSGLEAIELPYERQRRVAVAARVRGTTSAGRQWELRLANAHLDNLGGIRRAWIGSEFARTRQARGLREALAGTEPLVLGGDFNTWFGFADQVYRETAKAFPQTRMADRRRTFLGLLRLDHVFYRVPDGWRVDVRRADDAGGSDHHPLIATISF